MHMLSRRSLVRSAALMTAVGLGISPRSLSSPSTLPWQYVPKEEKPKSLTFVGWTFQNIYEQILPRFATEWGVTVEPILLPTPEPQVQRLMAMWAAGEGFDVFKTNESYLASLIVNGIVRPIDDMPGVSAYTEDLTPLARDALTHQDHLWGLPYYAAIRLPVYNEIKLEQAGIAKPFESWDELVEQGLKAKVDGVAEFPVLWVAGLGWEFASGTFYTLVANRGGTLFEVNGTPTLGPGSIARETLRWWQRTFTEWKISDPASLELRLTPAARVFSAGRHLYQVATQQYFAPFMNDSRESPIAGHVKFMMMPGTGVTTGLTAMYCISKSSRFPEWSWKLLQYLGGKTPDGEYTQAIRVARDTLLGSGYRSVMDDPRIAEWWKKYMNVDVVLAQWQKAVGWQKIVPVIWEPWFPKWNEIVAVEVQRCLRGEISADKACDNMIHGVRVASRG